MLFKKNQSLTIYSAQMANYCDEFNFEELFEDPSYDLIHLQVKEAEDSDYEKIKVADVEVEQHQDQDQDQDQDTENFLDTLEFINNSMTEEQMDYFWKQLPTKKVNVEEEEEEEERFNMDESYFQREILAI